MRVEHGRYGHRWRVGNPDSAKAAFFERLTSGASDPPAGPILP